MWPVERKLQIVDMVIVSYFQTKYSHFPKLISSIISDSLR